MLGKSSWPHLEPSSVDISETESAIIDPLVSKRPENIAKGTTDPEIDSVTCISYKFGHHMEPLALVNKLAKYRRHASRVHFAKIHFG